MRESFLSKKRVLGLVIFCWFFTFFGCKDYVSVDSAQREVISLTAWEFVPEQFVDGGNDESSVPWKGVVVPDKWPNGQMSSFGYGTYRLRVKSDDISGMGIQLGNIISSFRLYLDDSLIANAGKPAKVREREIARVNRELYLLPQLSPGKDVTLYMQISNFQYHVGGFIRPLKLGPYEELHNINRKELIKEAIQAGALGLMGIFLLTYFAFRQKEAYVFFFGLLSLGLMGRLMLSGEMIGMVFFPDISGEALFKIVLVTFYMGISLHYVVLAGIFDQEVPDWSRQLVFIGGVVVSGFLLVTPLHIGSFTTPYFQLFALVSGAYLLWCVFKAAMKHRTGAKTVFVGGVITFGFLVNDILYNMQYVNTGDLMGWAVIIYIFLIILVIARRFSSAMENEEGLLLKLANINRNLEIRVRERTQMIEKYRENVEAEARLAREKNKQLLQMQEEETTLKNVMVHDLRAPFNKILGLAKILRMNNSFNSKEESEISDMIVAVAEQGRRLIDDLNVLNMYDSQVNDIESFEETDIVQLLEDCAKSHEAYAQSKDIYLDFHSHHHVVSFINPNMLRRVVDNLISNAIKFSEAGTRVEIRLIRKNGMYEIMIEDQGPGFSEEDLSKVFGKFQKLSARPTKGESSTGLGLNIVKNLTELMGGKVNLYSQKGEGARFVLVFYVKTRELHLN